MADQTRDNDVLHLSMAINYSSRSDGIQAARRLATQCAEGTLSPDQITNELYAEQLWSATLPAPLRTVQMLIITGGVSELDDFMQIEAALARVFFTPSLWPAFGVEEFGTMLERYAVERGAVRSYETWCRARERTGRAGGLRPRGALVGGRRSLVRGSRGWRLGAGEGPGRR